MGYDKDINCVSMAAQAILESQHAAMKRNPNSSYQELLNPVMIAGRDTIPILLYTKTGTLFSAFGNVGNFDDMECFQTVFFRVERLKDCSATLSLLMPDDEQLCEDNICDPFIVTELEKTDSTIEVDLSSFCAIQCLSPELVVQSFDDEEDDSYEDDSY